MRCERKDLFLISLFSDAFNHAEKKCGMLRAMERRTLPDLDQLDPKD